MAQRQPLPKLLYSRSLPILFVGGSALVAAISVFKNLGIARTASLTSGIIAIVWIIVQIAVIGYVSWMQPVTAIVGALIVFLGAILPKHNPFDEQAIFK